MPSAFAKTFSNSIMAVALLAFSNALPTDALPSSSFDTTHYSLGKELARYVHDGEVRYSRWRKKTAPLAAYLKSLADLSSRDYEELSADDKKALWINAYNAFTIKLVLDEYPIKGKNQNYPSNSFRQIPDAWEKMHFKVAGRDVTLDQIEHTILRRDFHDSRIHYVVVCAAKGSPHLFRHAFNGKNLDADLELAKNEFLNNAQNIAFDKSAKVLKVSKLFQWFPLDFAPPNCFKKGPGKPPSDEDMIIEYLEHSGPPQLQKEIKEIEHFEEARNTKDVRDAKEAKTVRQIRELKEHPDKTAGNPIHLEYLPFDWSLNETDD